MPLQFLKLFPNKTLPFPYSLLPLHLILSPPTPTNTPPPGSIIFPIINSFSHSFPSSPRHPSDTKMPPFLIFTHFQADLITSPIFLTPIPPNPIPQTLPQ
ncbi:anion permease, partial [Staphylococcus epidermidis]|uniref:anion permease n=1 Tax=Staphylococcus epidermidis TaxID=1282 RepID=UPI0021B49D0F